MKRLTIAMAIGSLMACGGCGSSTAPTPPANVAGEFNATITASSTCSAQLPAAAWVLKYPATVTQNGTAVQVKLIHHQGSTVTVTGTVSGQTINFPSFSLGENMTEGVVALAATGKANVAPDSSVIAGTLSGTYQAASGPTCNAVDHQLELKRCVVVCSGNVCSCAA
jgi:hypothetical protein